MKHKMKREREVGRQECEISKRLQAEAEVQRQKVEEGRDRRLRKQSDDTN